MVTQSDILSPKKTSLTPELRKKYMTKALELAQQAAANDEVPVGAIIVQGDEILAEAFNRKEAHTCATQHAEILAIEKASSSLGRWRLSDCHLFVTLEPCLMCAGAILAARMASVTYGTTDPKAGAVESLYQVLSDKRLNHQVPVYTNVMQTECSLLLKKFFRAKRL